MQVVHKLDKTTGIYWIVADGTTVAMVTKGASFFLAPVQGYENRIPRGSHRTMKDLKEAVETALYAQPGGRKIKDLGWGDLLKVIEVYTALSPENLTCDGELSGVALARKFKDLQGRLAQIRIDLCLEHFPTEEDDAWEQYRMLKVLNEPALI